MPTLQFPVEFEGDLGEGRFETLFDSGANLSCINPEVAHQIASFNKLHRSKRLLTASENHYIEVNHCIRADFYLDDVQLSDEFLVVPGLSDEVIIGAATLQKWRIKLDFDKDQVVVDPRVAKLQLI
jgi:hypothetical protein